MGDRPDDIISLPSSDTSIDCRRVKPQSPADDSACPATQNGRKAVIFTYGVENFREALHRKTDDQSFVDAVIEGSVARLRPKLMTVATIVLSLSLIPFSSGPGMEIMKPIAAPSIGGMVSSTIHVLFMMPCRFVIVEDVRQYWRRRSLRKVA